MKEIVEGFPCAKQGCQKLINSTIVVKNLTKDGKGAFITFKTWCSCDMTFSEYFTKDDLKHYVKEKDIN